MKNGIPNYNEIVFTKEQEKDIIDSYLNGESSVKIGKRYNTNHKPILKVLHRNSIDVNQKRFVKKYELNENYFDKIDTPNKAYILGFLYADGHNGMSKRTITMSLQEDDFDILERIRLELGSNKPLEYLDYSNKHDGGYHYKNQYRLNIFSVYMCETLNNIGMVHDKSLKLEFPDIPEELYSHFIRGYFDGDGTISKTGTIAMVSTYNFCKHIYDYVYKKFNICGNINEASNHNGITFNLSYSKQSYSKTILEWLYKDADLFLERKYLRYISAKYNAA